MPPPRRGPVKLATPKLEVWLADPAEEPDAEPIVIQTTNADMVLTERTGRKHGWGSIGDSPIRSQTFMAWAALKRRGRLPDPAMTYEVFEAECISVQTYEPPADDDDDADEASPTPPGPVPG